MIITTVSAAQHGFWHDLSTWSGWNMTGAMAGVIAAVAVVPAVIRYFRDRYRPDAGRLSLDTYGTTTRDGFLYHLGELSNGGGAPVSIVAIGLVDAKGAWSELGEQPRWWLDVGASMMVPYLVVDQQKAWMLVTYVGMDNVSQSRTVWMPLFSHSEASQAHEVSFDEYKPRRWWRFWRWFREGPIKAVGPGGAWAMTRKIRDKPGDNGIARVMDIFFDAGGVWYSSGMAAEAKPTS